MQSSSISSFFFFHVSFILRLTATCSVSSAFPVVRSDDHDRRVFLNCFFHEFRCTIIPHSASCLSPRQPQPFLFFGTTCNCPVLTRRAARHKVFVNTERTKPKACSSVSIALPFSLRMRSSLSSACAFNTHPCCVPPQTFTRFQGGGV